MKPLVIYHDHCTDGFGAAFAAWLQLGDDAEYLPMSYGDTSPDMMAERCRGREVYILDFSFERKVMEHIFKAAKRVVWLDHHKTAFEIWCGEAPSLFFTVYEPTPGTRYSHENYILLDDCKSGALLAWKYFHPGTEVPMLIRHIDDRDRWQFKLNGSKELHAALSSYKPWSFAQWREKFAFGTKFHIDFVDDFILEGAAILRAQDALVKSLAEKARPCTIWAPCRVPPVPEEDNVYTTEKVRNEEVGKQRCAIGLSLNCVVHQSEVGHELANASGTYGLVWYSHDGVKAKCSLRSNGDYDVSTIAKAFGGGGHKNAAGFETDIDTLMGWLR